MEALEKLKISKDELILTLILYVVNLWDVVMGDIKRIRSLKVEMVRGIKSELWTFNNFLPGHPNIFVAPNGSGKTSIACAFKYLKNNGIKLPDEEFFYDHNESNSPTINLEVEYENGKTNTFLITDSYNSLKEEMKTFVINCAVVPKSTVYSYGPRPFAKNRLEIEEIVLKETIPKNVSLTYSPSKRKRELKNSGKILPNISDVLESEKIIPELYEILMSTTPGQSSVDSDLSIVDNYIEGISGTKDHILEQLDLDRILPSQACRDIFGKLKKYLTLKNDIELSLMAHEILSYFRKNRENFKKKAKYLGFCKNKVELEELISLCSPAWKTVELKEKKNKLVLSFPRANYLSNGERDILTFIGSLFHAQEKLTKKANLLIVDEVFDYLDDGNLLACQYLLSRFIAKHEASGKKLFLILLTHLNPFYFKHFSFKKLKVHHLKDAEFSSCIHMQKIITHRKDNQEIDDALGKYYLHFNPNEVNYSQLFKKNGLDLRYSQNYNVFKQSLNHFKCYRDENEYDPLFVILALRLVVEGALYNQMNSDNQALFLETRTTPKKVKFASDIGISIPESYYLLQGLYQQSLHLSNKQDKLTPYALKLQNRIVHSIILDMWDCASSHLPPELIYED